MNADTVSVVFLSHGYTQCTHSHIHTHIYTHTTNDQKWSKFSFKTVIKLKREKEIERDYSKDNLMT